MPNDLSCLFTETMNSLSGLQILGGNKQKGALESEDKEMLEELR